MQKVFLAGPMRGIPREESLRYRQKATKVLSPYFNVSHAMRGRENKETIHDPRVVVARDKKDIRESDIILVDCSREKVSSIGTSMEIIYAWTLEKIIILWGTENPNDYWLNYHSHARFDTLEEACGFIIEHLQ
jgi:nucleoside 2-deoxyribosyltransferase